MFMEFCRGNKKEVKISPGSVEAQLSSQYFTFPTIGTYDGEQSTERYSDIIPGDHFFVVYSTLYDSRRV